MTWDREAIDLELDFDPDFILDVPLADDRAYWPDAVELLLTALLFVGVLGAVAAFILLTPFL